MTESKLKRKNKRRILWSTNVFAAFIILYILISGLDTETGRTIIQYVSIMALSATAGYTGWTSFENIKKPK